MRRIALVALILSAAPALVRAGTMPVEIVRFVGTPADSADRAVFEQAFEAAFRADSIACERRSDGTWSLGAPKGNPFVRVDAAGSEVVWQLDLSVRFPQEVRVPVPRKRRQDPPQRARRSTLRTSRGFVFAVSATSPTDTRRAVAPEAVRYEVYFADLRTVVVPSSRLPSGAYEFPYDDAARVVARAAIEIMLRKSEQLAKDERVSLAPATRITP